MDGLSAWLLLSVCAASPQQPPQTSSAMAAGGASALVARANTPKKGHRRANGPAALGQPATPSPQLQSKKTLPALPTDYRAVALWPLSYDEADADIANEFETATSDAIDALPKLRAISPRDVAGDLEAQGQSVDRCDRDMACMAQLGRMARAHLVLEIRLVATGGITTVQARLIDTVAEREVLRLEEPLAQSPAERSEQVHGLITQLLAPADYVGSLQVRCDGRGAQIFLDNVKLGEAPLPPVPRVVAGVHILRIVRPGHPDVHRFIDVQFGRANIFTVHDVDNRLSFESVMQDAPAAPPPQPVATAAPRVGPHFPSWRSWTAVGLASAGALGVGLGGYLAAELKAVNHEQGMDMAALTALQLGDPQSIALIDRLDHLNSRGPQLERGQWVAIGTGAALLGVSAALVSWDWLRARALHAAGKPAGDAAAAGPAPVALMPTYKTGQWGLRLHVAF